MPPERPRVRFAPSPSGSLHLGNARTALFNWFFARRYGGVFVLRIEDTDPQRVSDVHTANLLEELRWLGLHWDEGPLKGGEAGPYHQSQRFPIYKDFLENLKRSGRVYPCYCSQEELETERQEHREQRVAPRYSGKCRRLTAEEKSSLEREGKTPAYRFLVTEGLLDFADLIRGEMKFDSRSIGDFIIVRSNGLPAYNFAVVVDDHLMGITHVIRGEDHLSNTAAQLLLYRALDFAPPLFAHHALILGADQAKLSKRHGASSVGEFRRRGYLPEALVNYLAYLGTTVIQADGISSREEIVDSFDLEKLGRSGAIFTEPKLRWFNEAHIRHEAPARLITMLRPFMAEAGYDPETIAHDRLLKIVALVKDNLSTLADIRHWLDVFMGNPLGMDPDAEILLREKTAREVLRAFEAALTDAAIDGRVYQEVIGRVGAATGKGGAGLYRVIRVALTGKTRGPDLAGIFSLLDRETMLTRMSTALKEETTG